MAGPAGRSRTQTGWREEGPRAGGGGLAQGEKDIHDLRKLKDINSIKHVKINKMSWIMEYGYLTDLVKFSNSPQPLFKVIPKLKINF